MKIQFPFEVRGIDFEITAEYHFAQKSMSFGERFAEPDDEGHVDFEFDPPIFGFGDLTRDEQNDLLQAAHDEAHETDRESQELEFEFY